MLFYALREQEWQNWGKYSNLKHALPKYTPSVWTIHLWICFYNICPVWYHTEIRYCIAMYKTIQTFKKHTETHLSSCTCLKPQGWNIFVICQLGITIWIVTGQLTTKLPGKMEWLILYKSHSLKVEFVKNNKVKGYKIITIRNLHTHPLNIRKVC